MSNTLTALKNIGLHDKEARVYLSLLSLGNATVAEISQNAALKRPNTYTILEELRQKGLVLKTPHAKKTIYQAKGPDELYSQATARMHSFEKILPELRRVAPSENTVKTFYFEGLGGLKEALLYNMDSIKDGTLTGFFAKTDNISEPMSELFIKFGNALKKRNVTIEGITPDDQSIQKYKNNYNENKYNVKLMPKEDYSSDISIETAGDFVRIVDPIDLKAVIIENQRVADAVKQIFNLVIKKV